MRNLRKKNELIKNRLTNIVDNLVTEDREFGGLGEWGEGLKKYKLADRWSLGWGARHRECSQQ